MSAVLATTSDSDRWSDAMAFVGLDLVAAAK